MIDLVHGDCIEKMREMGDNSADSIVTDPPYGLGFMGKKWDALPPSLEVFEECLRVLKPGGHLLAFGGSRTYHRLAVAVEDAGFDIRDQIMWVYGQGFPKSLDVSKAIDKAAGHVRKSDYKPNYKNTTHGNGMGGGVKTSEDPPATDAARQWEGWGTALKPAHEPIVMARKPLAGTVAANVMEYGTGAINVDGCRVGTEITKTVRNGDSGGERYGRDERVGAWNNPPGRFPANLIHDGSDEVVTCFPEAGGQQGALNGSEPSGKMGSANCYGRMDRRHKSTPRKDTDKSAARFFYCAKASKRDRGEGNAHPTVKPTELMRYLCRLVTPPGGVVLDPFMGSGSTGKAAMLEGFEFIGIELDPDYFAIVENRIADGKRAVS